MSIFYRGAEITPYFSSGSLPVSSSGSVTGSSGSGSVSGDGTRKEKDAKKKWHPCRPGPDLGSYGKLDDPPPGLTECEFVLDMETGYFAVRQGWFCDELDREHP